MDEDQLLWLLNSAPTIDGEVKELLVDDGPTSELVRALGGGPGPAAVEALRTVRNDLHRVIRGVDEESVLQQHLDGVVGRPALTEGRITWQPDFSTADAVPACVVLAWSDLVTRFPGRVRACSNSECSKFLVDHSRPNSARWCSMAECGNRLKARRHSARRASSSATDTD